MEQVIMKRISSHFQGNEMDIVAQLPLGLHLRLYLSRAPDWSIGEGALRTRFLYP